MSITSRLSTALADRYKIERRLGEGGMATVYLAQDLKHERKVALKVLKPELAAVLGAERFVQEIKTTANLQHPHILPLFDSGEADSFLYYVMPFIDGETLRDKLNRETQLGIDEAVSITTAIADALDYAHRQNVIHRDIKPENILLHDGRPMVADFGIALAVSAAAGGRMTETGLSLGTPHYMSPEQATAEKDLTDRSDVYSLGSVLYEMLTGEPPHIGGSAQAIIMKIVTEPAEPVTKIRKSVPPNVAAATAKSLEKLAADRFESAAKFAEALTNPAFTLPTTQAATMAGAPTRGPWKRVSIGVAVFAAAMTLTALWGWLRPTPSLQGLPARFEVLFPSLAATFGNRVVVSPDGAHIVYVGYVGEGQDRWQLYLRPMDQLEVRRIPGSEDASSPFFSPDGQRIGFATSSGLSKVSLVGGPPITIVENPTTRGASWGADEMIVFGSTLGLWRVPADGGAAEQLSKVDVDRGEQQHGAPQLLPGGSGVLFSILTGAGYQIAVLSLATGQVTPLFAGIKARYIETGHVVYGRTDGVLMAVPFDPVRLEVTGQVISLLDGVTVTPTSSLFSVSRTGVLAYLTGAAAGGTVVMVDRQGAERSLIEGPDVFFSPRFSPDGARLALGIGAPPTGQVWTYDMEQESLMPLTFEGGNVYPVWSWDGEQVAFASDRAGTSDLFGRPADGSGVAGPLLAVDYAQYPASFSRDGRYLIYREMHPVTGRDLWVLPLDDDREPWAFTPTPAETENAPALSPDGRWLAYISDLSGRNEVYVNAFPEPGGKRQVSVDGGTEPVWSRDGSELYYRNGRALMVAAVETVPDFRVRSREVLFEGPYTQWVWHSNYDVHPDGERFVMIKPVEGQSARLVVVLNWFEELRRRSGSGAP